MLTPLNLGNKSIDWNNRTLIMGILNVTPDSFSGDGILKNASNYSDHILKQVVAMVADGADIIDVGGESSRPGAIAISADEEIDRVTLAIETINKNVDTIISIDTYKSKVAKAAIELGATIVNDIFAMQADTSMAKVISTSGAAVVLMHNSSKAKEIEIDANLGNSYRGVESDDIVIKVKNELNSLIQSAISSGVPKNKIIIDPGFGFGKTLHQNLALLARLDEFNSLGYPVLSGTSRKSFIGHALNLAQHERLEGSMAAVALSIDRGAKIVRVHDVRAAKRVATLMDAVKNNGIN